MNTLDNRILIDENSLEHFSADAHLQKTTERFRRAKEKIEQRQN